MKTFALFVALILGTPAFPQAKIDFLQAGRDYTNLFYGAKVNDIWEKLSPDMKKLFGETDAILELQLQTKLRNGVETSVVEEHVLLQGEIVQYQRIVMFQKITTPVIIQWSFDRDGTVVGFFIRSDVAATSRFLDYKDQARFLLPFKGSWLVLSGGRTLIDNPHAETVDQRFAADLAPVKHGRIFSGDGTRPEQYFCFGQPILAPGAGTVVDVHDGVPDNPVNAPFDSPPAGNYVVIDYGDSEYSFEAHLKLGTIRVKVGDKVQPGEKIAKCGSSGDASIPHLHLHLQNTPVLFKGEGLPMQFHNYLANKKFMETGELVSGEIIRNKQRE